MRIHFILVLVSLILLLVLIISVLIVSTEENKQKRIILIFTQLFLALLANKILTEVYVEKLKFLDSEYMVYIPMLIFILVVNAINRKWILSKKS